MSTKLMGGDGMSEANLAVKEVAVSLGVTLTHVYNMVRAQRLPGAFKADGEWQVPQGALNDYLKRRQQRIGSTAHRETRKAA
jgi:excisionase family DNA binding protein